MITCHECKGKCCRDLAIEMDTPKNREDWDYIKWMVAHENVSVYMDKENDWLVEFRTNCKMLTENNECKVYEKRPLICKNHKIHTCVMNGDEDDEKIRFDTVEQVEEYIEKIVKPKFSEELKDWD